MQDAAASYPVLGEAYRLKEAFYGVYDAASLDEAQQRYEAWYRSVPTELRDGFNDLIRAWTNWKPYILGYFDHPITNAYTESLNNLIRVLNRLGRGYSFEALRAKILFTEGLHKHTKTRPAYGHQQHAAGPAPNYGVDISTLIERIESGTL